MQKYRYVVVGGTFDHFHLGHEKLLEKAFAISQKVLITIATDKLYRHKFLSQTIESYAFRKKALQSYLRSRNYLHRVTFSPLNDIYGKTKTDLSLEAIIVSKETYPNALKINDRKKILGLPFLDIVTIPYVLADDGKIISSERIRLGQIDRKGHSYNKVFANKKNLVLPEYLRESLRQPLGLVIKGKENNLSKTASKASQIIKKLNPVLIIAVGDIVAMSLTQIGLIPNIQMIDFKSRRKELPTPKLNREDMRFEAITEGPPRGGARLAEAFGEAQVGGEKRHIERFNTFPNPPGTINPQLARLFQLTVKKYLQDQKPQTIVIEGEEDLTALVAMLLSPLNSIVLYGQFDLGIIMTAVTEKKKNEVEKLLRQFE